MFFWVSVPMCELSGYKRKRGCHIRLLILSESAGGHGRAFSFAPMFPVHASSDHVNAWATPLIFLLKVL
jgi:hypothetical protein